MTDAAGAFSLGVLRSFFLDATHNRPPLGPLSPHAHSHPEARCQAGADSEADADNGSIRRKEMQKAKRRLRVDGEVTAVRGAGLYACRRDGSSYRREGVGDAGGGGRLWRRRLPAVERSCVTATRAYVVHQIMLREGGGEEIQEIGGRRQVGRGGQADCDE